MTWIKIVPFKDDPALARARQMQLDLYPAEYGNPAIPSPGGESIVASHSLIPDALYHAFAAYGVLLSPDLPLSRRQHEMIATVVSATNRCFYWLESHAEFLRHVSLDDALVEALKRDFRTAPIDAADRAMLEYVAQLSRDATVLGPENLDELRGHGFDDRAILQITLIASWFNYINRVADALGVGR